MARSTAEIFGASAAEVNSMYSIISQQRGDAIEAFQAEAERFRSETQDHSRRIDADLLAAFFAEHSTKPIAARRAADLAVARLNFFATTVTKLHLEVAALSMSLYATRNLLMLSVMSTQLGRAAQPLSVEGKAHLEVAKQGLASLQEAMVEGQREYISAMKEICLLEQEAVECVRLATLIMQVRRERLWKFRQNNLSVTWGELRRRAKMYGQEAGAEELEDFVWDVSGEFLKALGAEAETILWIKRARRWGVAVLRLAGQRKVNREANDTDLVLGLIDQLEVENRVLEDFIKRVKDLESRAADSQIRRFAE